MYGFGLTNSNGSVNLGPNSPVWADGGVTTCLGDACKADNTAAMLLTAIMFSVIVFFFVLKEGGWRRTLIASVIPLWIISATVYHFL